MSVKDTYRYPAALSRPGKIVNVIQHTRSSLSQYWADIGFYFINQLCALYIAFDKCFYICDV